MVIPAILEKDIRRFEEKLALLPSMSGLKRVQVDFADGVFVSNYTLQLADLPPLPVEYEWEAHLMVQKPDNLSDYIAKGFKSVIIHLEAFGNNTEILAAIDAIKSAGAIPAVALDPRTPVHRLSELSIALNRFLLLSVIPGKQGNPFLANTYERITELRRLLPDAEIEVDGGVNGSNVSQILSAGADHVAIGSGLFAQGSPAQNYEAINMIVSA